MGFYGYGYPAYVSAAQRRQKAEKAAAKAKKTGKNYSPIEPYRGAIAKTVWGKAWCDNLAAFSDYSNRLPRGATYVRNGSVIDLQITPGKVSAQVMGSSLYTVEVVIKTVAAPQWTAVCKDCSGSIDSLVELLQGKLSDAVMNRISTPKTGLFPAPAEISFDCSCPDWAGMCKHIAAVMYGVGKRLDDKPELLFGLRGVDAKDLVTQAGAGLAVAAQGHKGTKSAKRLDEAALADVFGLEMDEGGAPASSPVRKSEPGKPAARKDAAKKVAVKKPVAKKAVVKQAAVKRPVVKKFAAKTVVARKVTAKKSVAKKAVVKKPAVSKGAAPLRLVKPKIKPRAHKF